ncbi:hypothetical protein CALCODRAFT_242611 [Calocera cornea HHB12733]|uniref:Uncharacterized protein n=1 Tax=Calocera cornea HHB12733 TaxID=1353952 RepID=A0A165GQ65_9BASI|nr:hypothetical protein CALCODRAFT_242611 [Calocera cornea HHB12733]
MGHPTPLALRRMEAHGTGCLVSKHRGGPLGRDARSRPAWEWTTTCVALHNTSYNIHIHSIFRDGISSTATRVEQAHDTQRTPTHSHSSTDQPAPTPSAHQRPRQPPTDPSLPQHQPQPQHQHLAPPSSRW